MLHTSAPANRGHVLIVDDDELFRESVIRNLVDAGFTTTAFEDGHSVLRHLGDAPPGDLMLLDWKMPGLTGIEVLRKIRTESIDIPIILFTVLGEQIYEEAGLLGGAVDFVEKSRSFSILLRRIELALVGQKSPENSDRLEKASDISYPRDLMLRRDSCRAAWKGIELELTLTEFNIVALLAKNAGRDVSYREIYDIVRGEGFVAGDGEIGFRTNVRAFIKRIRQKFRDVDPRFSEIRNYPSFGYRWYSGSDA